MKVLNSSPDQPMSGQFAHNGRHHEEPKVLRPETHFIFHHGAEEMAFRVLKHKSRETAPLIRFKLDDAFFAPIFQKTFDINPAIN